MATVRRNRSKTPRYKRMKRVCRLQLASHWVPKYEGKDLIRGYSKHFAVDPLCAIKELLMLGLEIPTQRIAQVQATVLHKQRQRARKREREKQKEQKQAMSSYGQLFGHNEYFAFIGGSPRVVLLMALPGMNGTSLRVMTLELQAILIPVLAEMMFLTSMMT